MRLIDADGLLERVGRYRLDTREAIVEMIQNEPTVIDTRELKLKELECGPDDYRLECERLKAQVHALAFSLRCNCVSGNEVTYEDYRR